MRIAVTYNNQAMEVKRDCKPGDLNWAALPELREKLKKEGFDVGQVQATLNRLPDAVTYFSLEEVAEDVKREGASQGFYIRLTVPIEEVMTSDPFSLIITKHRASSSVGLAMTGLRDRRQLDSVMEFLGLEPADPPPEPVAEPPPRPRTAFIAHRFDEAGTAAAEKLGRFLELLGFRVVTGLPYSPRPVSEKVLARIEGQELVFVIVTPGGDDDTWLNQETAIAEVKDKNPFLITEQAAKFKAGILGDHEHITFVAPNIEAAFIPVLEGLRDLGYLE